MYFIEVNSPQWKLGIKRCHPDLNVMGILLSKPSPFLQVFLDLIHLSHYYLLAVIFICCQQATKHLWVVILVIIWNIGYCDVTCYLLLLLACQLSSHPFFKFWLPFYDFKPRIVYWLLSFLAQRIQNSISGPSKLIQKQLHFNIYPSLVIWILISEYQLATLWDFYLENSFSNGFTSCDFIKPILQNCIQTEINSVMAFRYSV